MKKLFLAVAAVATLFATSCKKENINGAEEPAADNEFICVIGQNANPQNAPRVDDGMGQMAHIDASNNVWWQEGDQIAYYGKKTTNGVAEANAGRYVLTCSRLSNNSAYFSAEDMHFYQGAHEAYYPASIMTLNGTQKVLKLPSTINLEAGKNAGQLPMYGTGTGTHYLTFSNICAVLKITIPSSSIINGTATRIEISSDKAMNGVFTINNNTAVMSATSPTAAQKKITVQKSSGNFATNEVVYVAVPAQTYNSLSIAFIDATGHIIWKKDISNATVAVSKVYPITLNAMNHQYVDLGLSVKWATCNIGANSPYEYGGFFGWGETTPRTLSQSGWGDYTHRNHSTGVMTKYCGADGIKVLEPGDDAAHVLWGGNWRMPTEAECKELRSNCTFSRYYDYSNSVWVVKIQSNKTGYTNNYIIIPCAGYYYLSQRGEEGGNFRCWSSTLCYSGSYTQAYQLIYGTANDISAQDRCMLNSIRPVWP